MPRYINEDEFCEYIRKNTTPSGAEWFISKIKDMPAADVVEVKYGEWTEKYEEEAPMFLKRRWVCSVCGKWQTHGRTSFCPNCGADMRRTNSTGRDD